MIPDLKHSDLLQRALANAYALKLYEDAKRYDQALERAGKLSASTAAGSWNTYEMLASKSR